LRGERGGDGNSFGMDLCRNGPVRVRAGPRRAPVPGRGSLRPGTGTLTCFLCSRWIRSGRSAGQPVRPMTA
jgi:hypothetical protein